MGAGVFGARSGGGGASAWGASAGGASAGGASAAFQPGAFQPGTIDASGFRRKVHVEPLRVPFANFGAHYAELRDSPLALAVAASDATGDRTVFNGELMQALLQHKSSLPSSERRP